MNPKRVPFTVLATMMFLVLSFDSTPSDTAIPDPLRLPDSPPEGQSLQDLARWVMQSRSEARRFQAITPGDLEAALSPRPPHPRRFGLFPGEDADAARRELLVGLPYGSQIWQVTRRHRVDGLLVAAIVQAESRFSPHAVSPRGAVGLMQIMPATAEIYGTVDLYDPAVNLEVGSQYLAWLLKELDGDVERAVAAYNAGLAPVLRYGGVPPYPETRRYVSKVLALYREHSEEVWDRAGWGRDPFAALPAAVSAARAAG